MTTLDLAMVAIHLVFAGLWAGGVAFVTLGVLPRIRSGDLGTSGLTAIMNDLTRLSRASAIVLLLTGGFLAGTRYTTDQLLGTGDGYLVLAMVGLWLAFTGLVEVGANRVAASDGTETRLLDLATVVGVLLLVVGGVLTT